MAERSHINNRINTHLIEITMQVSDKDQEIINIYEEDDIESVVSKFCIDKGFNHQVQEKIMDIVALKIDENIENLTNQDYSSNKPNKAKTANKLIFEEGMKGILKCKKEERIVNSNSYDISELKHEVQQPLSIGIIKSSGRANAKFHKEYIKKLTNKLDSKLNSKKCSKSPQSNIGAIYTETKDLDCKGGERLYNNFIKKQKKRQIHLDKLYKIRDEKEMKEATFTPNINRTLRNNSAKKADVTKVEDRLLMYGSVTNSKIEGLNILIKMKEYDNAYVPKINEKSIRLAKKIKDQRRLELKSEGANFTKIEELSKSKLTTTCNDISNIGENHQDSREEFTAYKRKTAKMKPSQHTLTEETIKTCSSLEKCVNPSLQVKGNVNTRTINRQRFPETSMKRALSSKSECKKELNKRPMFPRMANMYVEKSAEPICKTNKSNNDNTFNTITTIHDELYLNTKLIGKKAQLKMKEYRERVYPFKPSCNALQNINISEAYQKESIERLYNSKKAQNEKLLQLQRIKSSLRPTFKPQINKSRSKSLVSRREMGGVSDYYSERIESKLKSLEKEELNFKKDSDDFWKKQSMKKIAKMKIIKAKENFDLLDSDRDGFISIRKVKFVGIEQSLISLLGPILEELQNKNKELNFQEFFARVNPKYNFN